MESNLQLFLLQVSPNLSRVNWLAAAVKHKAPRKMRNMVAMLHGWSGTMTRALEVSCCKPTSIPNIFNPSRDNQLALLNWIPF